MSAVWVAIMVAVIGPTLLTWLQGRQHAADRREDWERQDLVAERLQQRNEEVAARAHDVAIQTQHAAQLLLANNKAVDAATRATNTKLDVIHTLVNSNMTAALQGELDSTRANLVTLRELIGLRVAQGQEPDDDARAALAALEEKVGRLASNLQDRVEQTKVADAQIFVARETTVDPGPPSDKGDQ
jgi:hypothetical protein